jgi:hypothetical protein
MKDRYRHSRVVAYRASEKQQRWSTIKRLQREGVVQLLADYRVPGESGYYPSEEGVALLRGAHLEIQGVVAGVRFKSRVLLSGETVLEAERP